MTKFIVPAVIMIALIILLLTIIYIRKRKIKNEKDQGNHRFSQSNTKNQEAVYTYMTCPRCNKRNYVNKNSLHKLCNNCGWNLTEPYIHKTVHLNDLSEGMDFDQLAEMKVNDRVFVYVDYFVENDEKIPAVGIYSQENKHIGWVPEEIAEELIPKLDMSARVFGKIKKKHPYGLEIVITNDVQKMWGY